MIYDVIIIGGGISGLYSFYKIKQLYKNKYKCLLLEKDNRLGGRAGNDDFHGAKVAIGAGILRKNKDKLLINLCKKLKVPLNEFTVNINYNKIIPIINIIKTLKKLKSSMKTLSEKKKRFFTFKQYFISIFGKKYYNNFKKTLGYTDYENEDAFDVIQNYGMDDNACCWKELHINWKHLVAAMHNKIGYNKIKTSMNVVSIKKTRENPCLFLVETDKGIVFECNKVIVATTIDSIKQIVPGASSKNSIYNEIKGQNFLRLYGKFSKKSSEIMKEYVKGYTIVPGPLQKIIPMDASKGVYMIAYADNLNATFLKKYLEDTPKNRDVFCYLLEKALGICSDPKASDVNPKTVDDGFPDKSLELIAIKDYYWPIGTHYYTPLSDKYENREEFIHNAQNPEKGILVVGEVVSNNQGWSNGALSSVKAVLNKNWVKSEC